MTPQRFRLFTIDSLGTFGLKNIKSDPQTVGAYIPQIWGGSDQLVRRNLLLNTATLATQNVTTLGLSYTLYLKGTGSVTLSGAATGTLNGTGANNRVSLQFTATAGTLTLTVSGSVTEGHLTRTATTDHSYQAITDWTTEVYAYNAQRQLPWLRWNWLQSTEDLSNATYWLHTNILPFGSGSVANGMTTPRGFNCAKLVPNTTTGVHQTNFQSANLVTSVAGAKITYQVYIKTAGYQKCMVISNLSDRPADALLIDLSSGNASVVQGSVDQWSVVDGGSGGWIVTVTQTKGSSVGKAVYIRQCPDSATVYSDATSWTPDGTSGIYVGELHLEFSNSTGVIPQKIATTWPATYTALAQAAGYQISLYSDRAGTTAVDSPETVVGKMLDLSTKGNHLVAPTDAARPLLKRDGNGNFYLLRDGVDDSLNVTLPNYGSGCVEYLLNVEGTSSQPNELLNGAQTFSTPVIEYGRVIRQTQDTASEAKIIKYFDKSINILAHPSAQVNDIGIPGLYGFGVGICPSLPSGFSLMTGTFDPLSGNYGNYIYSDGSVMCWIPAFYMRLAHASNPTYAAYGVNSVDIKSLSAFADEGAANAAGYYLHRAFVNGGTNQLGFFRDKYDCSLNGIVASSIRLAMPMVSGPSTGQVGFSGCTANGQSPTNIYAGAIPAARSRGSKFHPETVFQADALSRLSDAHAQAAASAAFCAWWTSGATNFPKGCDNNALAATDDATVKFTSAGASSYPNFALTGSGNPFAKTTHNGQDCGVSDIAGNIWKINPGMTCIAVSKTITGATKANPVQLTVVGHGLTTGTPVLVTSVGGMTQINDRMYTITSTGPNTFTLDGVNGTGFSAFTSGGSVTTGTFYLLKPSANIELITNGNTLTTDHWGAAGVAANFDAITPNFATTYSGNGVAQRYGNGASQVFGWDTGANRALAMAGLPLAGGISIAGANLFGLDYFYQYVRNELYVVSSGSWNSGSSAGARARRIIDARSDADNNVGFAASRYL